MANGFGKARYGKGGGTKWFKVKEGDGPENIFRILPPMKLQSSTGKWFMFFANHYGYTVPNPQDESKFKPVPFKCIEEKNWKTQMITATCPECEFVNTQVERLEDAKKEAEKLKLTGEALATYLSPLTTWLEAHNTDRKFYMNVMNSAGEFGVLGIGSKAKKALDREIEELRENGIDPLELDQGAWFQFIRTGKGRYNTDYDCKYVKVNENVNGKLMMSVKTAPLTEEQANQALTECPDLTEVPRVLTSEQIRMLLSCGGEPSEVEAILGISQLRDRAEASPRSVQPVAAAPTPPAARPTKATPTRVPATSVPEEVVEEDDAVAAAMAALEAAKAAKAKKTTKAPAVKASSNSNEPATLSDEDFLSRFPDPNLRSA